MVFSRWPCVGLFECELVTRISQQTVRNKLKSVELEGVRVRIRARAGWRIHVDSSSYDNQVGLFERG